MFLEDGLNGKKLFSESESSSKCSESTNEISCEDDGKLPTCKKCGGCVFRSDSILREHFDSSSDIISTSSSFSSSYPSSYSSYFPFLLNRDADSKSALSTTCNCSSIFNVTNSFENMFISEPMREKKMNR